jgi:hypothetical protein
LKYLKKIILFLIIINLRITLFANTEIESYFIGTDYELNVYTITGEEEGATLLIIGGIQGDEPAGFLSADYFVDLTLKKGNLIVIPRANLHSIFLSQRQVNYDMNRRFKQDTPTIYEDEVVEIIKQYINKADLLLNLHEGSGFYRPEWEGPMHNPKRYGQCIIADTDVYLLPDKTINLKEIAEFVIDEINQHIDEKEYRYSFNNHNTISDNTIHIEQRKSASYYGLTKANIPSFGIEVSKNIPSTILKKQYIKLIIKEFMKYFDIQIDYPYIFNEEPELLYILCEIDNQKYYFENNDKIILSKGSSIEIKKIYTNYERGNYADIIGFGNKNDINKRFRIDSNTEIKVYKDNVTIANIPIRIKEDMEKLYAGFRVKIYDDNSFVNIELEDTLFITEAVDFEIIGTINNNSDITINLLGYDNKTAKIDDQHFKINSHYSMINRYAVNADKNLYQFIIKENNNLIGYSYLKVEPIIVYDLNLYHNNKLVVMSPGDTLYASYGDTLLIEDVEISQISSDKVKVNLAGYVLDYQKDAEDRGANIYLTEKNLINRFAINKEKNHYEIHILFNQKQYAVFNLILEK